MRLRTWQAAKYLRSRIGLGSERSLKRWRARNIGPAWIECHTEAGRKYVFYLKEDLDRYAKEREER